MARRRGGVPPIVTVLITISAIVAASLVAWFMFVTTRGATQTPVLEVTSAYLMSTSTNKYLYLNMRNLGPLNITNISFPSKPAIQCASGATNFTTPSVTPSPSPNSQIAVGGSFVVQAQMTTTVKDGDSCTIMLQVTTSSGTYIVNLGFRVAAP